MIHRLNLLQTIIQAEVRCEMHIFPARTMDTGRSLGPFY